MYSLRKPWLCIVALAPGLAVSSAPAAEAGDGVPDGALRFSVTEGRVLNEFYRHGPIAAHLVLRSGPLPRLVVAFPAGNSGTALWLDAPDGGLNWQPDVILRPALLDRPDGRLHGVTAEIVATGTPVTIEHAILSSVRVIRDFEHSGDTPAEVLVAPEVSGDTLTWERRRLDGAPGYYLSVEIQRGSIAGGSGQSLGLHPDAEGLLQLQVTALTGDTPLAPIPEDELLTIEKPDRLLQQMLAFLSYEEKLLAGSWRFNTYFGRDTLMSLRLLMPALRPHVVEAWLGSVLERLSTRGEVAHEEDTGEFAVLRRVRRGEPPGDAPLFDYKMLDDNLMLPVVAADYLLDTPAGRKRAAAFLARQTGSGNSYGETLVRNFRFVAAAAEPYALKPDWQNLLSLEPGEYAGNWRDSEEGLGGGRIPYDVNGVFVPAALRAIAQFQAGDLLQPYTDRAAEAALAGISAMADVWRREAPAHFSVELEAALARAEVRRYARRTGIGAGQNSGRGRRLTADSAPNRSASARVTRPNPMRRNSGARYTWSTGRSSPLYRCPCPTGMTPMPPAIRAAPVAPVAHRAGRDVGKTRLWNVAVNRARMPGRRSSNG